MERAFGRDFGAVRVHSDASARASANALNATAWTLGSDIVLGAPATAGPENRRVLAHELAHVAQQRQPQQRPATEGLRLGRASEPAESEAARAATAVSNGVASPPLTSQPPGVIRRQPKPGSSVYEEHVESFSTNTATPGVTTGTVRRDEFGDKHALLGSMRTNIRFSADACEVTVPVKVAYREPTASDISQWEGIKPNPKVPTTQPGLAAGKGRAVFERYIKTANSWLNNWFNVRLDGCAGAPCADRPIPIKVDVHEDTSSPDYTVAVVNASGRSSVWQTGSQAQVVLEGDPRSDTLAHEAGHMTLAHGDEYEEAGRPIERVRTDRTLMGDHPGAWSELHERHFAFVPAFMSQILSGGASCKPRLEELRHATGDVRFELTEGLFSGTRGSSLSVGGGIDIGSSSSRARYGIGPHATLVTPPLGSQTTAYMLGLRASAEYKLHAGGNVNLPLGVTGEAGYGVHGGGPYVEGGVRAGIDIRPGESVVIKFFAEAAVGTSVDTHDPENQRWFRTGLGIGLGF